jgi:hypothetical protein
MQILRVFAFLTFLSVSAQAATVHEADSLMKENSFLKSEHQLAGTSQLYFVFDLTGRRILIKAKGVVLRELRLESFTVWGAPIQPKPLTLLRKGAIVKPGRAEIKHRKEGEEGTSELIVLQLEDMPTRYRLNFDDGIRLFVRPKSTGFISTVFNLLASLKSYLVTRPLGTLWNGLCRENYTEVVVYLNEKEGSSLYWSFQEGFRCIIRTE